MRVMIWGETCRALPASRRGSRLMVAPALPSPALALSSPLQAISGKRGINSGTADSGGPPIAAEEQRPKTKL